MRSRRARVRVTFGEALLKDLERILDHLSADSPADARRAVVLIMDAMQVLGRHQSIGRPVQGTIRELVIGQGRYGFVALYRHLTLQDRIEVLRIRHQREAGYT